MKKVCRQCQLEKPIEAFAKNRSSKDGYLKDCKDCNNEYRRQIRLGNHPTKPDTHPLTLDLNDNDTLIRFALLVEGVNICYNYMDKNGLDVSKHSAFDGAGSIYLHAFIEDSYGKITADRYLPALEPDPPNMVKHWDDEWEYSDWLDSGNPDWYLEPD